MEDEDDSGNGINRRRVEKSVDISIGYVRSSVSTGQRKRRKRRQAEEGEATGEFAIYHNCSSFEFALALDLALSAKYSSFSRGNISYPTHSITFRFIDRCHLYRVTIVVAHLGWADLDLGCSTLLSGSR